MFANTATFLFFHKSMNNSYIFSVSTRIYLTQGLLEYILLNMDFNYDKQVPDSGRLQFRYCCWFQYYDWFNLIQCRATATSVETLSCLGRLLNSHRDSVGEHCKFRFLKHLCMNYSPRWWCADRYQLNNNWTYICSKRVTCDFSWCSKFHQYLNFL